ncbi:hypothetical protein KEM60_01490 [Austwickia sp. TVS 96-490-7B]|uniref:hypothetical protein n=1 Tax=Austwickia sp. TVS 96-490-7B TaxID=2830843 RepID=UPI001C563634|nr:hypothetical protein [Austwickia sp. TVS 96-490-7B]MBW3085293.1 hypothetical protein [Austwickia sp. TVS 96-490-7B]
MTTVTTPDRSHPTDPNGEAAAAPTVVLADDAAPRRVCDPCAPTATLLAPVLAGQRQRIIVGLHRHHDPIADLRALIHDVADAGLFDIVLRCTDGSPDPATHAWLNVIAALRSVDPLSAACVTAHRTAIDLLAHGHPSASNDRLQRALRRGAVTVAHAAQNARALDARRRTDGSLLVKAGRLRMSGVIPGAALIVPVALGPGEVVLAWTGLRTPGVAAQPVVTAGEGVACADVDFRQVVIAATEVIAAAPAILAVA